MFGLPVPKGMRRTAAGLFVSDDRARHYAAVRARSQYSRGIGTGVYVEPLLLEDFSTYSSIANFLTDPRNIWNAGTASNTSQLEIDASVGYGSSPKSLRLDWPNNGPNDLNYVIRPGLLEIPGNQTEIWVEYVVRFSNNFALDAGAPGAEEFKLGVAGDLAASGRWNFPEMGETQMICGYPGNEQSDSVPFTASSLWNEQPHVFRFYAKLGSGNGALKFWINGSLLISRSNITTDPSHTKIDAVGWANLNEGPNLDNMKTWFHKFAVYNTNPGW